MLDRFDWKFFLTIAITIASVAVPVWLWQLDLSSKAITLTVKSTAELQPQGVAELDGVQVLVDGKPLLTPFVSVLEISNNGSRPVVASDFEGPIRIAVAVPSSIAKIRHTSSNPTSLAPTLTLSDGAVLLQPLLLNPGDVVRLTLVTANGKPQYSVRGRIAGVSEVSVSDASIARETRRYWMTKGIATLLLSLYIANMTEFVSAGLRRRTFLPWSLATGLVTAFAAVWMLVMPPPNNASSASDLLPPLLIAALISTPYIFRSLRRSAA